MKIVLRKNMLFAAICAVIACNYSTAFAWNAQVQQKTRRVPVMKRVAVMREVPVMKQVRKRYVPQDYRNFRDNLNHRDPKNPSQKLFPRIPMWGSISWHQVLGVDEHTTNRSEIRRRQRELTLATAPDKHTKSVKDPRAFQAVNEATQEALSLPQYAASFASEESKYFDFIQVGTKQEPTGDYEEKQAGFKEEPIDGEYEVRWRSNYFSSGVVKELRNTDKLFTDREKAQLDELATLTVAWKRFYATKLGLYIGLALGHKYFKDHKRMKMLKARWKKFKKDHPKLAKLLKFSGRSGFITLASLYPLYKFSKMFLVNDIGTHLKSTKIPGGALDADDLHVFSRSYEKPFGYANQDQVRRAFMPIRKAKVMSAITAAASLASAWLGCVL